MKTEGEKQQNIKKQRTIYQTNKTQSRPTSLRFTALEIDNMCRCASLHCQASECFCMLHFCSLWCFTLRVASCTFYEIYVYKRKKSQGRITDLAPEPAVFFWLQAKYVFVDSNSVERFVLPTCLACICFNWIDLSFTSLQHGFRCPFNFWIWSFLAHEVQLHTFTPFIAKGGRFEVVLLPKFWVAANCAWVNQITIAIRLDLPRIWSHKIHRQGQTSWNLIVISSLFAHALTITAPFFKNYICFKENCSISDGFGSFPHIEHGPLSTATPWEFRWHHVFFLKQNKIGSADLELPQLISEPVVQACLDCSPNLLEVIRWPTAQGWGAGNILGFLFGMTKGLSLRMGKA